MAATGTTGGITPESIDRLRVRVGVPYGPPRPPHNTEAHPDTIRHFAWGYGDDNPLWVDPSHAEGSRWRGLIAPPLYLITMGEDLLGPLPKSVRERSRGALAGVHQIATGGEYRFYSPVRPGDRVYRTARLVDVDVRESTRAGGTAVTTTTEVVYQRRSTMEVVATHHSSFLYMERDRARSGSSKRAVPPPPTFTPEEIERVDAALRAEQPRGATPRFWEDLSVGDPLGPIHKGPLTITDTIALHIGMGPSAGEYGWGPLRIGAKVRQRIPGFYTRNDVGAWDVAQRLHWDAAWAAAVGESRPYDYVTHRTAWMAHLVTDWMGDDGWLESLRTEMRGFNYIGDLTVVDGTVTDKPAPGTVAVDVRCVNQREEITATGRALVRLPLRSTGSPDLPQAPAAPDWQASKPS